MLVTETAWGKRIKTDVLILGTGASGVGAALRAAELKADVLMVGQGRLESSGCLGGGNDHFMAALGTDEPNDTREAFVGFFMKSAFGYREAQLNQWFDAIKPCVKILEEVDTEFLIKDGKRYRSVGFGQPGAWLHITNGTTIKRHLARRVRKSGVNILDDFHITRLFERGGHIMGCMGFNVLTREVYAIECKTAICSLGWHPQRLTNNSTGNPYNCWHMPYNTGSYFVLPMQIGASLVNIDISGRATLIPKGWGAPGMNGINNMGGKEINALGERFMFKYDPMGENGKRRNQVMGTWQEQVEGNGPPFYMDMTHFSDEDASPPVRVMPADGKPSARPARVQEGSVGSGSFRNDGFRDAPRRRSLGNHGEGPVRGQQLYEFLRRDVLRLRGGVPCRERCGVHRDGRHRRRGSAGRTRPNPRPLGAQGNQPSEVQRL
ncbi:MAG: FAD-binding protein [Bilophila wadsworthia]